MNTELFIVRRISFSSRKTFSAFIIRISIVAIVLSIATMILATAMVNGFQTEIRNKVFGFWAHLNIVPFSLSRSLQEQGVYRYADFYTNPKLIPEAKHIQVMALKGGLLKTKDDFEGIILKGVGNDFDWSFFQRYLKEGRILETSSDSSDKELLISRITANRLNLHLGDKVVVTFMDRSIRVRPFRIRGIFETGLSEYDKQYCLININVIQELNHWGKDTVGGFEVFLKDKNLFKSRSKAYFLTAFGAFIPEEKRAEMRKDPIDVIGERVYYNIHHQDLDVKTIKEINPGIFDWLDLQTMNELIILSLMILVACINMITALLILILERTNMIGILQALGAGNGMIRRVFLYYSAYIIGIGIVVGNVVGLGLCWVQMQFHLLKLPEESYYLSVVPIQINWVWVLGLNVATFMVCLLLLNLPALLISRITPVKAIRFS